MKRVIHKNFPEQYIVVSNTTLNKIKTELRKHSIRFSVNEGHTVDTVRIWVSNNDFPETQQIAQLVTAGAHRPIGVGGFFVLACAVIFVGFVCKHIFNTSDLFVYIICIMPLVYLILSDLRSMLGMQKTALRQLPSHPDESLEHYQQRINAGKRLAILPLLGGIIATIISLAFLFLMGMVVWRNQ